MEVSVLFTDDITMPRDSERNSIKPFSIGNSDTFRQLAVNIIAVLGPNGEIGYNGDLLWHLPEDLRHFKELTMGAAVIMGRKTWESLPKKPLPGRLNIVVTRNAEFVAEGAAVCNSLQQAIETAKGNDIFIIGGGEIYRDGMQYASKLLLTEVLETPEQSDTFFPEIDPAVWHRSSETAAMKSSKGLNYRFVTYVRKS